MPDVEIYSGRFRDALRDYIALLNREYAEKPALKLIGDRYRLSGRQRLILFRGAAPEITGRKRRGKLVRNWGDVPLHIDGYNVLFTITNYLLGKNIFIAFDGFLRDAGESYGRIESQPLFSRSVDLLIEYLSRRPSGKVFIYLDENVPNRSELAVRLEQGFPGKPVETSVITGRQIDKRLAQLEEGVLSTSDSQIIDRTGLRVFDLARKILELRFKLDAPDLKAIWGNKSP